MVRPGVVDRNQQVIMYIRMVTIGPHHAVLAVRVPRPRDLVEH
jgi:hypothetical protein